MEEEAAVRIVKLSKEKSEQMIKEAIQKNRIDRVAEREYAREEGLDKGLEQGLAEGFEKGFEQGTTLVASNMLKNKMKMSLIAQITGLSEEEILKLKKKSEVKN